MMLLPGALELWKRQRHGPRMQVKAISYITERLESLHVFADVLEDNAPSLTEILRDCKTCATPDVSVDTLRRWWNVYQEWGELPYKVAERKKKMKGNIKYTKKTNCWMIMMFLF